MRLIDADELKAKISRSTCNYPELMWKKVTCDVINNQPTAYDIDKVVEQIQKYSFCGNDEPICDNKDKYNKSNCDNCNKLFLREFETIDIIRNGGKE